ncbi:MAG TPA: hypothetical protein VN310_05215 [Candidatus Dormibacteraeota bacterium]|jgi:hypothetical protein|nr:hypothetical protein [Candidatus Dormibacteraeota bacterium]
MAQSGAKKIWVTLGGLPLTISLEWPFHRSTSGADFWVLHGDIRLEGSEGLHAPVAVNLSATVREVVASLEPGDVEAPVINALRKEVDRRQIEFVKSGKLKPVPFSSRHYDFKREKWVFGKATDEVIATFLERKVYWGTKLSTQYPVPSAERVWIGDPTDAQYLESTVEHLVEVAGRVVAGDGLVRMDGEFAVGSAGLMGQASRFESAMRAAVEELEKKHAFERG